MARQKLNNYFPLQENQKIQHALDLRLAQVKEWEVEQLRTAGTKDHLSRGVISAIKEAVVVQENFSADMQHLKNILITLSGNSPITENEQKIIDKYIQKIDKLVQLYNELNDRYPLIIDKNTSPEDVIKGLNEKYMDPQFYAMMEMLASLEYDREKINSISVKYEHALIRKNIEYNQARTTLAPILNPDNPIRGTQTRDITSFTIMPMQNLPRISMVIRAVNEQLIKFRDTDPAPDYHVNEEHVEAPKTPNAAIENLLTLTSGCLGRSGPKNTELQKRIGEQTVANYVEALYSSRDSGASVEHKKTFFLREILNLNLNTPIEKDTDARVKDFPSYLETILVQCYPEIFALNPKEKFSIKASSNAERYINIHKAIGADIMGEEVHEIKLNPAQFNAARLDELYKLDHNPLWLVLKSTKPIDSNFTAEDKVKAYIELAQSYKAQKIGETKKYSGAYNMAQAAFAIAQKNPECQKLVDDAFGPKSELGQWIISKHSKQDQAEVSKNLSQYSHVQYVKSVKPPSLKKPVISPSQALLILIDHYEGQRAKLAASRDADPEKVKAVVEKVAELKKLYLLGVRIGQGEANSRKFDVDQGDLKKMEQYLADPCLSSYDVSKDKKIITSDPTRRYFETHLAYETVKNQIDGISKELLQTHVTRLTEALAPQERDAAACEEVFSNRYHGNSKLHKEYANYIAKIKSKELYSELNDEQREKIILLVKSSLLGVANAQARGEALPINIYNTAPIYGNWKGKEIVQDQETTANAHMGLMKNYMPIGQGDIATSTNPAPPVKPSDQATYKDDGEYAKWVEMNFAGLVHPFSNAISGTMLCQLRNLAEQKNGDRSNASGITDSASQIEKYTRVFIAAMLYGSGGHTLNEYSFPFQLEEVCAEFAGVDGFTDINLETLFFDNNDVAFNKALNETIAYNAHFLQRQRINQDIQFVGSHHDSLELAQAIDSVRRKIEKYESDVEKMLFSQHRTASKKVDIMKPAIEQIIEALKEGKVAEALEMSNRLMKRLEHEYGTKGFTGGEKKSYQIAKEIHGILSELDSKSSRKENITSVNLSFKERLQQLKAQEKPLEVVSESDNTLATENNISGVVMKFKERMQLLKNAQVDEPQEEDENSWDFSI
ncbi:TPA: hypothetical protein ACT96X_001646 [Legionella pneumophila]|uniref:hypothetical protein n=1 Tax=Legionella pneumophila TaxID=446 RepID=UPI000A7B178A|nr:hypothetical protein [Legionella pneumophila]HBD7102423.1 hypothetical protein [Legionella pneumophila]HCO4738926.1 hypothetical protein [Legionella pneumophila]HDU7929373.1 hypothetical protein [Legionella pneumophila]HDU7935558.1 hypothetical protein [Legionella pneumophila]HDU7962885.1 hypothetical protein [Legionella pneumophila]